MATETIQLVSLALPDLIVNSPHYLLTHNGQDATLRKRALNQARGGEMFLEDPGSHPSSTGS